MKKASVFDQIRETGLRDIRITIGIGPCEKKDEAEHLKVYIAPIAPSEGETSETLHPLVNLKGASAETIQKTISATVADAVAFWVNGEISRRWREEWRKEARGNR